jgi:hypothetical protein
MKKALLVAIAVITISYGYSQTEKGNMLIGGQISISGNTSSALDSMSLNTTRSTSFSLIPNVGFFICNNFAIGASLNFGISNTTYKDEDLPSSIYTQTSASDYTYGIGVFARKYFKIADKFMFFINGGISYSYLTGKTTETTNSPNIDILSNNIPPQTDKISVNINPGLVYFISPKLGIETSFGSLYYNYTTTKNKNVSYDNHDNNSSYGINLNISTLSLGLHYYL